MKQIALAFLLCVASLSQAFASNEDQAHIDRLIEKVTSLNHNAQIQALKQLQWSGVSSSKLYDPIAEALQTQFEEKNTTGKGKDLAAYRIMALGYSGNDKYIEQLESIASDKSKKRFRRYAKNALKHFDNFQAWNKGIQEIDVDTKGLKLEKAVYYRMLSSNDSGIQRLAARAMFHEKTRDPILLDKTAEVLEQQAFSHLGTESQDAVAWFCKVLGQNGGGEYRDLLSRVIAETPHPKIAKYASKYM